MKVTVIGLGLIGGSLAKSLIEENIASHVIGVDASEDHGKMALEMGIVQEVSDLKSGVEHADLVIIATPVNTVPQLIREVLDHVVDQTIIDVGSTKLEIIEAVRNHPKRANFVATHPMAGTEFSGPTAAISGLFTGKYVVLCNETESHPEKFELVRQMYLQLGMKILIQDAKAHDMHVAYVSHISHISSFALAITVLNKEKDEDKIFELASTGFSSTVRLAKSSPETWVPIFEQNRDNVLDVLDEHITVLSNFRSLLIKKNYSEFYNQIIEANKIKKILK